MQELNVIRIALLLLRLELQQQSWHTKVKDVGITSTFILKKTAASYDNRHTAILSVFIFCRGGAGVGMQTKYSR